jgi:hypothetical protein
MLANLRDSGRELAILTAITALMLAAILGFLLG